MSDWRARGGATPATPKLAGGGRSYLARGSLAGFDKEGELERDKDQVKPVASPILPLPCCPMRALGTYKSVWLLAVP